MKINTIVDIFRGNLLNTPYISYINEIKIDSTLIKQGDLFVALDSKDISTAIDNNAYAVIFDDNNIQIDDDEIAWIKVKDIKKALFNYLRMYLLENKKELFFITPFQKDILSQFNLKNISIIEIDTYFENIVNDKQFYLQQILNLLKKFQKVLLTIMT
jgi:ferrochelatase